MAATFKALFVMALLAAFIEVSEGVSAADQIGTVKASASVDCAAVNGQHGLQGAYCYEVTVACSGLQDQTAAVKLSLPVSAPIGLIGFMAGGGAPTYYDTQFKHGMDALNQVVATGYMVAQIVFPFAPIGNTGNSGWITTTNGVRAAACRPATLLKWLYDTIRPVGRPLCFTGNSGGASAGAYLLAEYGFDQYFRFVEFTSGPTHVRIDHGCLPPSISQQTPCGLGDISELFSQQTAMKFVDPAYGTSAICSRQVTRQQARMLADSSSAPDAINSFPDVAIHFVFGGLDNGPAVPQAMEWLPQITARLPVSVSCVADAPHGIADSLDGATQIATDLIANCN